MNIRAVVLEATGGPLTVSDLELAPPGPEEVLVRLGASGVCHSDWNAVDGTSETPCPAVLGHEGAGVVEAVGTGVSRVRPGDHVALSWAPACGTCEECRRELPWLCSTAWPAMGAGGLLDGTSRLSRNGDAIHHYSFLSTFAEACVVPERSCVPIPHDVPLEIAGLVGCAVTTGLGAVWRTAQVQAGDRVAVVGCGGVGLSAVMAAVATRAEPIVAVDAAPGKLDAARSFGATETVLWQGAADATADAVREVTGGGVDFAVEATGRPEAMLAAFLATRPRGAAVLIGIPRADAVLSLPAITIPRLERRVLGSIYGSSKPDRDFPHALELYREGTLPLDRLVSHRLPLDDVERGFELMASGEAPNGAHVNAVLAHRGSPTAGAAIGMLAHPAPGHTPVLVCLGATQQEYEPVWPPTLMMNKATALEERHETITWGAGQLGVGQGVLDAVADGLFEATGDLLILVAIWIDPAAEDETAVRLASRAATRKALGVCVEGRDPQSATALVERRDSLRNPFYGGS